MTEPPDRIPYIRLWIGKAEHDLLNADHTLLMNPEICPFDTVCFHAQQLAEKYLKAYLVHFNIDFHKTHDLNTLVHLIPVSQRANFPLREDELAELSEYAVAGRYPGAPDILGSPEAGNALRLARQIREWIRAQLPPAALA